MEIWSNAGGGSRAVLLGRKKPKTSNFYAKDKDLPTVCLVAEYFEKSLSTKVSDYRDKSVMQFDGGAVKILSVSHNGKSFIYQKDAKGQWTAGGRANAQTEATNIINKFAGINIVDFAGPGADTGLESPSFTVDVALTDGTHRVFRFGKRLKDQVYLASDKTKDVYLVQAVVLSDMEANFSTIMTPVAVSAASATPTKK
jgi:hypothetical protein